MTLEGVMAALSGMPADKRRAVEAQAASALKEAGFTPAWVPNPGPQTEAYFSEADELFYGGEAGGGKSSLLAGLATTSHRNSLLLRRTNTEVEGIVDEIERIVGSRKGYSQRGWWLLPGRSMRIGGCQLERDKQKYKGRARDLMGFDEIADFTESQYTFIIGWNRSADKNQRCRVVAGGNPPTTAEGLWVTKRWGAWLDPNHARPAKPGELRWFTTIDGKDTEVDGPGPHEVDGEMVRARSRTFIRSRLSDNPDLAETNYGATLANLPEGYRLAYRDGRFDIALQDRLFQVIPTEWIRLAQGRWTPQPPAGIPMCALAIDIAQGGGDQSVIAMRHDGYYAKLVAVPGVETPDGPSAAALVIKHRRDGAAVIIDMGGGYGGSCMDVLKDNGMEPWGYKGAKASMAKTEDGGLGFRNRRSQAYWQFREALDPSQPGGSPIALDPDDITLMADLTACTFSIKRTGIELETKEAVTEKLGRSPDRGDAVVMAWQRGVKTKNVRGGFTFHGANNGRGPRVIMGHGQQSRSGSGMMRRRGEHG